MSVLRYKESTSIEDKRAIANTLIREMSIHGDAEEVTVYNDYTNLGLGKTVVHNKGITPRGLLLNVKFLISCAGFRFQRNTRRSRNSCSRQSIW